MKPNDPILTFDEIRELCEQCGRCCIAEYANCMLGGTMTTDAWLRMLNGECRYLLPPDHQGCRRCAIYDMLQTLPDNQGGWSVQLLRPELCRNSPTRKNLAGLPDCPVKAAAEEKLVDDAGR